MRHLCFLAIMVLFFMASLPSGGYAETRQDNLHPQSGVALHGLPKYGPEFTHLDYVNPDAPKGGAIRLAASGTFDSLHPYILKGIAAPGLGLVYQTLMTGSEDEAFSQYGQIAESVEIPTDRDFVIFNLRPSARWQDGQPITAQDVVWTFNTLMKDGHPSYRAYYAHVRQARMDGPLRVRFDFDMKGNRELPMILGQMPVLPEHYWKDKNFAATTLTPPLGSGPYRVARVETGHRVVYERVKDWWAKDLPINRGQYNFDTIAYDLYRDDTVLLQAFFSGDYDFRSENVAKSWATAYDQRPAVRDGRIIKKEVPHHLPAGMQAFIMNMRRPLFADIQVRQALNYAFDFEWSNKQFAYSSYKRTQSFFENSELAARGLPQGDELKILEKYKDRLPAAVFTTAYQNPQTNGSGAIRDNLSTARKLLSAAGWRVGSKGLLEKEGHEFRFEILCDSDLFERWLQPFVANLAKLGIEARLRMVDTAQYQNRLDSFDFDMTPGGFGQSLSPGNEQRDFWGSDKADVRGSRNLIGIKDPVVDALIQELLQAPDRSALIARTRALDRVLLSGHYVIPNWYFDRFRIAYWEKFGQPSITPQYGLGIPETWWYDAKKAEALKLPSSHP